MQLCDSLQCTEALDQVMCTLQLSVGIQDPSSRVVYTLGFAMRVQKSAAWLAGVSEPSAWVAQLWLGVMHFVIYCKSPRACGYV